MDDLSGSLQLVDLRQVLQWVAGLRQDGRLRIWAGRRGGEIGFADGQIVAAHFGSERGLAALEAIALALPDGRFAFAGGETPVDRNIEVGAEELNEHLTRMATERDAVSQAIPSLAAIPRVLLRRQPTDRQRQVALDHATIQTLLAVDGRRSVEDLAVGIGLVQTLRDIAVLAEAGLVAFDGQVSQGEQVVAGRRRGFIEHIVNFFIREAEPVHEERPARPAPPAKGVSVVARSGSAEDVGEKDATNPWPVLVVLCLGFFMILLDTTIVNIAIPSIVDGLQASLDQILWVINAYVLVHAVLLITAGRLGDIVGPRALFAIGLAVFTAASAGCGLAQDITQLVVARVIQGVGAALLTPQTLAILTVIFLPHQRGAAFGIWGGVAGIASIAGPTLGGFLVTTGSWRWIFFVNVPIGILALIATFLLIPDLRLGRRHNLDLMGVFLATLGLMLVVFGLIEGQRYNWGPVWGALTIPALIVSGFVVLAVFFAWEVRSKEPLVPLSLFRSRNFSVMNLVGAIITFGMLGLFLPIIIYLQSGLGMTALEAGLTMAPMSVVSMLVAPFAGRLADRGGGKYIPLVGLLLFATGIGSLAWLASPTSTALTLLPSLLVAGFGLGCIYAPITIIAMFDISPSMAGAASGMVTTTRQLGGVIGSAIVGAVLQNRLAVALQDQFVSASAQLPESVREPLTEAFRRAASVGLEVGRSRAVGAGALPLDLPPQLAAQIQQLLHDVFVNALIEAMRPTLSVPIAVILLGALTCLLVQRPAMVPEQPVQPRMATVT